MLNKIKYKILASWQQFWQLAVHKAGRWVWSTGDGSRRLLTALDHVCRRRHMLSTPNDNCRLFQHTCTKLLYSIDDRLPSQVRSTKLYRRRTLLTTLNDGRREYLPKVADFNISYLKFGVISFEFRKVFGVEAVLRVDNFATVNGRKECDMSKVSQWCLEKE